ncbi:ROK family protein [Nocardia blacklockiae]|uniref:ROK family protein n=1 Tax=Nocardia blacklockiae TaxID=480036 RepID=UPI001895A59F|nr:ROK family protein [Nocardia blacklockiae]MBF6175669.1 ROK family protein [Nocardia blacklockiae]
MTRLALEIGPVRFAAGRVADDVGEDEIRRIPVPDRGVWDACRELLLDVAGSIEVSSVGIAAAGPIDMAAGIVAPTEISEWRTGFAIVEQVRKLFPAAEVRLAFDGVCLALAERNFGATSTVMDSLSIFVSDRVVAGISVGGFTVVGRTGNAGHIGHMLVPGFDDRCGCGGRGCLEAVASEGAVLRWATGQGWTGGSAENLLAAAVAGESIPVAALERAGTALGRVVASVAPLLDIDLVAVGGPLAQSGSPLWKPIGTAVATHARLGFLTGLRVVPSELGAVGVLAGAGVLAMTESDD